MLFFMWRRHKHKLPFSPKDRSRKYYVTRISYDERIIGVVDINLANGSCSLPYNSSSADYFFSDISDSAYRRLPCFSDQSYNVYVNYGGYFKEISDLPKSFYCSPISKVPIPEADGENPSYEAILQLLKSGFNLRWSVKCRNCVAAGHYCSSDGEHCYKYGNN
ncbi:hypothetical protein Patl1_15166 [Pistacia atlantica]|uniref:Uncharacterized protein n=1 Tax=Pistacia atlantica TaxID=434234 RepID=A0ACC1BAK1_9ROSI|nr:hypothetical protein Patl1_15166 [Pistacia atlantica]